MKINTNLLKNDFIPKVKKGKNNLEDAYDILAGATVPSDFSSTYKQELKKAKKSINSLEDDLNDLKTYASEKIDSFKSAESKNEKLLKSMTLGALVTVSVVNTATKATENAIENGVEQIADWLEDTWYSASAYITQKADDLENLADEAILQASNWWTGAKEATSEWWSDVKDWASETYEWATGALETVENCIFDMVSFVSPGVCAVFADIENVSFAIIKGLANVVEGIVDAVAIVGTAVLTVRTGLYDITKGIVTGDWDFEATTTMWKGVMSFVANDYVGMAYDWFYEDTAAGEWLNETAHSPFKTDGVVTGIAETIGEVAGVIILTIATAGIGTAVTGSVVTVSSGLTAAVAATSAFGRATESNWNKARENEEEGEDWRTFSTWYSGIVEGILTGAWEGTSWYLGSDTFLQKFGSRAVRIAIDSAMGAFDVPARAYASWVSSSITSGGLTSYVEAFNEEGGWMGVLTNAVIAGSFSALFEYVDYRKTKKAEKALIEEAKSKIKALKEEAGSKAKAFLDKYGVTSDQIDDILDNKVKIIKKSEWDKTVRTYGNPGWTGDTIRGFYSRSLDRIFIPEDATVKTLIHEMMHALGSVYITGEERALNEGITEALALIINGDLTNGSSAYKVNVGKIRKIIENYSKNGYNGEYIVFGSYLSSEGSEMLKNSLNAITGDSLFYTKLVNFMDIADGCGDITDVTSRLKATTRLTELIEKFENAIKSIN